MLLKRTIKPLSVNECWQGRRYKTELYKAFEKHLLLTLPAQKIPKPPYSIYFEFGFSNAAADWDNPVKPLQDILQKRYKFNDNEIYHAEVVKKIVPKGEEYFLVKLKTLANS